MWTPRPLKYSFSSSNRVCLGNTQYLPLKISSALLNTKSPHTCLVSYYPLLTVAHILVETQVGWRGNKRRIIIPEVLTVDPLIYLNQQHSLLTHLISIPTLATFHPLLHWRKRRGQEQKKAWSSIWSSYCFKVIKDYWYKTKHIIAAHRNTCW